jgi:hypothetical protein
METDKLEKILPNLRKRKKIIYLEGELSTKILAEGFSLVERRDQRVEWLVIHPSWMPKLSTLFCVDQGEEGKKTIWGTDIHPYPRARENEVVLLDGDGRYPVILVLSDSPS